VARSAQIEVLADSACDKLVLRENVDAVVAGAGSSARLLSQRLGLLGKGTGHALRGLLLELVADRLGRAGDELAIFVHGALHKPVVITRA